MPSFLSRLLAVLICLFAVSFASAEPPQPAIRSPLSPEESLKQFVLPAGLKAEIVACEPAVVDPVAMRFDEQGRLWVVEMRDYPNPPEPGEQPKSQIRLLEDRDGDGRYESFSIFAEGLLFATGVQPWQGGVLTTISGQIIYLKDTNGDGKADVNETWYTGFAEKNPQLRVNHPRFALDNHVYVASGLQGGEVVSHKYPKDAPIELRNRDVRFDPHTQRAEAVSGNGQFGMTFDDWGDRFTCSNRRPLIHVVLENRYLGRNPLLAIPAVLWDVAAEGEQSHVYPLSQAWTTSHLHAGQFTAACGVDIYRGDALPAEYRGNSFTCEPTGNLVHREVLTPAGGTFTAKPDRAGVEFLATRDGWFRPVAIESGPDGALYVVDMYRAVIEHPQFMPEELKNRPDLRYGEDRGRIYRIVPVDGYKRGPSPQLADAASQDLVKLLEHENAWWRETAARLLFQRQDRSTDVRDQLEQLAYSAPRPATRVQAMWALTGLGYQPDLNKCLSDSSPRVREQAILLAEPKLASTPDLRHAVIGMAGDSDGKVRFQAALSLGAAPGADLVHPLALIALAGASDAWTRRAVETSVGEQPGQILTVVWKVLAARSQEPNEGELQLVEELAGLVGAQRNVDQVAALLAAMRPSSAGQEVERLELAILDGLAGGMRSRGKPLLDFQSTDAKARPQLQAQIEAWFKRAAALAADPKADDTLRKEACQLLASASFATAGPVFMKLLASEPSQALRLLAVSGLAAQRDPQVGRILLDNLGPQTPSVRGAMLDALLSQTPRVKLILDDIAAGKLKPNELDTTRANRLLQSRDPEIKARATKLLAFAIPADRAKALETYQAALELKPNALHGKEVFRKNCSTCHKIDDVGVDVGPSIGDGRTKTTAQMLMDIIQPSKVIDNNFVSYSLITDEGNTYTGLIAAETPTSVTMKLPEGKVVSLLRTNIEELHSNGISLMPEGLERNIPLQDMANLISFIKNWRYLSGQVPLGTR